MSRGVLITLDRERKLRFTINGLIDLEQALGAPLGVALMNRSQLRTARALIWKGLQHEDKRLTEERVGELLQDYLEQGGSLKNLTDTITEALKLSGIMPDNDDDDDPNAMAGAAN